MGDLSLLVFEGQPHLVDVHECRFQSSEEAVEQIILDMTGA